MNDNLITNPRINAVLFDLDGTLVDTALDFVRILHDLAQENSLQIPSDEKIREQVSAGSKAMVSLFLDSKGKSLEETYSCELRQQFLDRYEANICIDSSLFDGLDQLLLQLDVLSIPWGVVTNKPRYLAEKLLLQLGLSEKCSVLVCPEDVMNSKPDPEPMFLAMQQLKVNKELANTVLYVGDHIRDISAGNQAGNVTIAAAYGYLSDRDDVSDWYADYTVMTSVDLVNLIFKLL